MHPQDLYVGFAALVDAGRETLRNGGWNSLIGILTAIVGNVLISAALNIQRYAHLRIQKAEADSDSESGGVTPTDQHRRSASYDTLDTGKTHTALTGRDKAVEREEADDDEYDYAEHDALLPSAHKDDDSDYSSGSGEKGKSNYLKSPFWWLGIILMTVGEAGNFIAYGFAPASIVSPLGVVALISNCLIAPLMLGEKFRKRDLLGVVIAVGGAVTVVLSAQGSNPKLGPDEIYELVKRWEFLAYLGITVGLILVLMVLSNKIGHKFIVIDLGLVGLFGGYTALSTKGVASLLSYKLWRVLQFPVTYVLVLILVATAVLQIKYVNRALARFDSTQVIPVQFVMFTISVIVGSAILYRDFETMGVPQVVQFVGGCGLTFLGVWCITSGRTGQEDSSDARKAHDEEQGIILEDDEHSTPTTPQARFLRRPPPDHTDSPASFATARSQADPPGLAALHNMNSTPSLPTQHRSGDLAGSATSDAPFPTPTRSSGSRPTRPTIQTNQSDSHQPFLTPSREPHAEALAHGRFGISRARSSIAAGVSPKPLTTPLSSGLSVIVADSLRKTPSTAGRRKKRSSQPTRERPSIDREHTGETDASASEGPSRRESRVETDSEADPPR